MAEVLARLSTVKNALRQATLADGTVDLLRARQALGADFEGARVLKRVQDYYVTGGAPRPVTLTPEQAAQALRDLEHASDGIDVFANWSGQVSKRSVLLPNSPAEDLVSKAAAPKGWLSWDARAPESALSLQTRSDQEARIAALGARYAKTPEGAEALAWDMRQKLINWPLIEDLGSLEAALQRAEGGWRALLNLFRNEPGKLSDEQIAKYLGTSDFAGYVQQARQRVNGALLMDYDREYLAGIDLR